MEAGALVKSAAGHDKGRFYIVLRIEDGFAYLADGKRHGLNSSKKKRLKHIVPLKGSADVSRLLCDAHVRKQIKRLINSEGGCHLG